MQDFSLKEALFAAFYQYREVEPDSHIYVLLDLNHPVAVHHPLHLDRLLQREAARSIEIVRRPDLAHEAELCPRLVQLYRAGEHGYVDEELVSLTLECAFQRCQSLNGAYVAAWIVSPEEPQQLSKRLASVNVTFDVRMGKQRHMPLFEPYRTALVVARFAPDSLKAWMGSSTHWLYADIAGQLQVIDAPRAETPWIPLRLSREHFAAMERIHQARFALKALANSDAVPRKQPELSIDNAVRQAHEWGLSHTEDVVLFVLNDFTVGPAWSSHPASMDAIQHAARGEGRLSDAMEALPDHSLESIAEHAQRRAPL
ncbi:hypothetical protein M8A51_09225 [Schlegelella sp. S2-27]|uniref:DUF4123 domain-containing protein n=1 Tax=Caldimonas mangrovi TaxID=2944811 RepID=A0ABT0YLW1_9BURK|nr:hypothetical protein [Caldimonas mangrovi]MCM5679715.1 hypothetical protein [Caldimonas mangrovi]